MVTQNSFSQVKPHNIAAKIAAQASPRHMRNRIAKTAGDVKRHFVKI